MSVACMIKDFCCCLLIRTIISVELKLLYVNHLIVVASCYLQNCLCWLHLCHYTT